MTEAQMKQRVLQEVKNLYLKIEALEGRAFIRPKVTFSKRMTSTAGRAFYPFKGDSGELRFSVPLMMANSDEFVSRTVPHEIAHLVAVEVHGYEMGRGHGSVWRHMCKQLGMEDVTRTHSYKRGAGDAFRYICDEGTEVELSKIRHNKLQAGKVKWYKYKTSGKIFKDGFIGV